MQKVLATQSKSIYTSGRYRATFSINSEAHLEQILVFSWVLWKMVTVDYTVKHCASRQSTSTSKVFDMLVKGKKNDKNI